MELLGYLDAADGWVVERAENTVDVHANGLVVGGDDPVVASVRGAVATQLFAHAIETAGAQGYLYLLDFYMEDELPTTARVTGRNGVLERDDLDDATPQDRMDLVDKVRGRMLEAQSLWSVSDDEA